MRKTIIGVFPDRNAAEQTANEIRSQGFRTDEISLLAKNDEFDTDNAKGSQITNDNISDGVTTGGVLGGLGGLLLGAGTLAIPGLGIIAGAGPLIGLLTGAVGGGLVGGLVDLGISEEESRAYEGEIQGGKVIFAMHGEEDHLRKVEGILRNHRAEKVRIF